MEEDSVPTGFPKRIGFQDSKQIPGFFHFRFRDIAISINFFSIEPSVPPRYYVSREYARIRRPRIPFSPPLCCVSHRKSTASIGRIDTFQKFRNYSIDRTKVTISLVNETSEKFRCLVQFSVAFELVSNGSR